MISPSLRRKRRHREEMQLALREHLSLAEARWRIACQRWEASAAGLPGAGLSSGAPSPEPAWAGADAAEDPPLLWYQR